MCVACQSLLARLLVTNITCNTHKLYTFFSIRYQNTYNYVEPSTYKHVGRTGLR